MPQVRSALRAILLFAILLAAAPPAHAAEIAYEGFQMAFPTPFDGGRGFGGPWAKGGFNAFSAEYAWSETSLLHAGLQIAAGSVSAGAASAIQGALRPLAQPLGAAGTTVYVSFVVQPRDTLHEGVFNGFFGLTLKGTAFRDLFVGKPGAGATARYVIEERGGAGQVASDVPTIVNRTVLLVIKAQFLAGDDVFTLYADPPRGAEPDPSSGFAKSDLDLGTVSAIGVYSTGAFAIDEVRIGTTWADVVPSR